MRLPARRTLGDVHMLIVTGTLIGGFVVASVAAASTPPVPLHSQQAIKHRTKLYAYVPARVPLGLHYYRWSFTPKPAALRIAFRNKAGWEIVFSASAGAACTGKQGEDVPARREQGLLVAYGDRAAGMALRRRA